MAEIQDYKLTFRLILHTRQKFDFAKKRLNQTVKQFFMNLFVLRVVFGLLMLGIPVSAQAGVISFMTDLFSTAQETKIENLNSQNMTLLKATVNFESETAKGGGDITIIENSALKTEVGPFGSIADINETGTSDKINIYVVRKGDSLSNIAKMFDVSVNTIIWANDLHNAVIKEGQILVILPVSGIKHTVEKGETLNGIAKKYKGDLEEITQYNDLSVDSKLSVGDVVIIPDGDMGSYDYSPSSSKISKTKNSYKGGSGPDYVGFYIKPVNGKKSQGLHVYNAVDIAAPIGTPIVASASGSIIISRDYGWNGGYGKYIVIQHNNGTQTLYGHCSEIVVSAGQYVVQGQVIGYVGSTGRSTGPHIHFEIRGAKNPF